MLHKTHTLSLPLSYPSLPPFHCVERGTRVARFHDRDRLGVDATCLCIEKWWVRETRRNGRRGQGLGFIAISNRLVVYAASALVTVTSMEPKKDFVGRQKNGRLDHDASSIRKTWGFVWMRTNRLVDFPMMPLVVDSQYHATMVHIGWRRLGADGHGHGRSP